MRKTVCLLAALCCAGVVFADMVMPDVAKKENLKSWSIKEQKTKCRYVDGKIIAELLQNAQGAKTNATTAQVWCNRKSEFKSGTTYRLECKALANVDCSFVFGVIQSGSPYQSLGTKSFSLKKDVPQTVSLSFTPKTDVNGSYRVPQIGFGTMPVGGKLEISDCKLIEIGK
ncbi:MAG: hypothetical protein PHS41_01670 [Victivallaceae bacterium]|nr:hypothetical protein [Victivallaceae bacterium]